MTETSNTHLVNGLRDAGAISSERVRKAMCEVDRAHYVLENDHFLAYTDTPQEIEYGHTIAAPSVHARVAETLIPRLTAGARVLVVGSGSGYLAAVLHHIVCEDGAHGYVTAIENDAGLVHRAGANLRADGLGDALDAGRIRLVEGDGECGFTADGPYDAIYVSMSVPVPPQELISQLACPGRMLASVADTMLKVDKSIHGEVSGTRRIQA